MRHLGFVVLVACNSPHKTVEQTHAVELPKLGLSIDLAGKTAFTDESYGNGYIIRNPSIGAGGALHVAVMQAAETPDPKADLEAGGYTNVVLDQKPDGWFMTAERADMTMGAKFFVFAYRMIEGKHVDCHSTGIISAAGHQVAIDACKSLRLTAAGSATR